jgi:hypothetical protein
MSHTKKFKEPPGKIALPEQKIHSSYGKIKANSYETQAHDGLLIPQVSHLMKIKPYTLKQADMFDETGDGKTGKLLKSEVDNSNPGKKNFTGFIYNYKKRI